MKLIKFLSFASLVLAAGSASLLAQSSGTWNTTVTPSEWNSAPNWVDNTIADGAGNTADFSKLNIVANTTVNLTVNRTIGNLIFGDTASPSNNWTLAPGGGGGGQLTLAGGTPTITVNNLGVGQLFISAVINGSSGLTKNGTGTLNLTGNNTFTGGVTIKDGTLRVSTAAPLTNAGTITIGDGSGTSARLLLSGNASLTNNITIGSGVYNNGAIEGSVANSTVSGNITITAPGPHFNTNSGIVLTLQGKVTYTGGTVSQTQGTVIYAGSGSDYASIKTNAAGINTIKLGANNGLATGATVDLSSTTKLETFDLAGFNQSVANLKATVTTSTNSTVTNSGGSISTLTLTSGNNTFAGVIQNGTSNVAVVVNGANQTLSGANTYTGNTTISAGTLVLAGTGSVNSSSKVIVANAATFTNSSSVAFNTSLTLAEGAILNGTGVTGAEFAPTSMTITADLTGGSFSGFALGATGLTKAGNMEFTLSGITAGTYTVFSGSALAGNFSTMTIGGTSLNSLGGGDFSGTVGAFSYTFTDSSNALRVTAVPEPAAWVMAALGLTAAMVLRRRRD